jgi:pimeloyl-ACP methyl ester carboxylesterase
LRDRSKVLMQLTGMRFMLMCCLASCATVSAPTGATNEPDWLKDDGPPPSLAGQHVVFVAGYLNELIPGYFTDNAAVARELGAETSILYPGSKHGLNDDVNELLVEVASRRGAEVVLFGHSKGAAAVLLTVLQHPELVLSGQVSHVILVQGAIGGSPLADSLRRVRPFRGEGIDSLTTEQAKRCFGDALEALSKRLTPSEWAVLFARIFYVRSAHDQASMAAELALTELLLRKYGPNDGLVPQSEMKLSFGVDLGVLDADHASLVVSGMMSTSTVERRRSFTLALFREVGRRLGL